MAKIATKSIDVSNELVRWSFANGEQVTIRLSDLPDPIVTRLALHGLSQKGGDAYAGADGKGWTLRECAQAVRDIADNLVAGIFNAVGGGTGGVVVEALARLTEKSLEDCKAVWDGLSESARKELRKRPDVDAMVKSIQAERAAAKVKVATPDDLADLADLF